MNPLTSLLNTTATRFDTEFENIDLTAFDARRNYVDAEGKIKAFIRASQLCLIEAVKEIAKEGLTGNIYHDEEHSFCGKCGDLALSDFIAALEVSDTKV